MFCKYCGTKNQAAARFCRNCGRPLSQVVPPKSQPAATGSSRVDVTTSQAQHSDSEAASAGPTSATSQARPTGTVPQPATPKRPPHQHHYWWLIIVIIVVVAIGGGAAYVVITQRKQSQVTTVAKKKTPAATKKETSQASQSTKKQSSSVATKSSFPKATIRQAINTSLSGLKGTTSVAVAATASSAKVVQNDQSQRAASLIKLFILITAYEQADSDQLNLDETYTLTANDKVGGTGTLQGLPTGSKLSYREILKRMMDESDNTAANIMIDKVGGISTVNAEIERLDLSKTQLERKMMDTDALADGKDNYTSVTDVATVLTKMYAGKLISPTADQAMLTIMRQNANHAKLPHDLPSAAIIYNKTGEYGDYGVQNDAAIIKNKHGAFVVVVLSQGGDEAAQVTAMNSLGTKLYQAILEDN
ncbi:serine hydrolase [Lactobacillus sp. CBA3606]|uniref:serine hydrolase n=1 Tax=Lactobacillus sp. CBA3606 TaxID=2099789 RepID=UPI001319FC76|nr:serine hydrolase [Lactobacillus sp. CBA3606]